MVDEYEGLVERGYEKFERAKEKRGGKVVYAALILGSIVSTATSIRVARAFWDGYNNPEKYRYCL